MEKIAASTKLSALVFALFGLFLPGRLAQAQENVYVRTGTLGTVVLRGNADSHIWALNLLPTGWQAEDLSSSSRLCSGPPPDGATAVSTPMGYVRNDGYNTVVYSGKDQNIYELSLQSGTWCLGNLSGPAAAMGANPWGYVRHDNVDSIVYRGSNSRIYEIYLTSAGWGWGDLMQWTSYPALAESDPVGYVRSDGVNAVVYIGNDYYHIHELSLQGGSWQDNDLTARTAAQSAAISTKPAAFIGWDATSYVAYTGYDGHAYVLSKMNGNAWQVTDLTPGGTIRAVSSPAGYRRTDGYSSIVFVGSDGHIYEAARLFPYGWGLYDLSFAASTGNGQPTPPAGLAAPAAYIRKDNYNSVVYTGVDNNIYELTYYPGGRWHWWQLASH